jgi:hypothetical protein
MHCEEVTNPLAGGSAGCARAPAASPATQMQMIRKRMIRLSFFDDRGVTILRRVGFTTRLA